MKRLATFLGTAFISCAVLFLDFAQAADAPSLKGKWGFGLRGGVASLTQDVSDDAEWELGPIVSANLMYGLTDSLTLGLNVEWERNKLQSFDTDLGDAKTVSFLAFTEFRMTCEALSTYLSFGAGLNFNSFEEDATIQTGCNAAYRVTCDEIEPENTFALKASLGVDYFVTSNLALNTDFGWKINRADAALKLGGVTVATRNFNVSLFAFLFGLRYYF